MLDYTKIDQAKLFKADKVSEFIKKEYGLSHIRISLNMINDDINVELKQKEASQDVLSALKDELGIIYHSRYRILPTPILSGSYMDTPSRCPKVLYNFEKM